MLSEDEENGQLSAMQVSVSLVSKSIGGELQPLKNNNNKIRLKNLEHSHPLSRSSYKPITTRSENEAATRWVQLLCYRRGSLVMS